ncbi:MAG TPA: hypothetical protein PKA10_09570 [Selenomonadales bacterium]|nr:hypothetical protein [Selenomonadales bacterium]
MGGWYNDGSLEEILRNYPVLKAQASIDAQELRHLFPNCTAAYGGRPRGGQRSDSTGNFAAKREEWSRNIRRVRAIEIACEALTEQERELVRLMYFERWNRHHIQIRMGVQRSHMFNIRRNALDKLAEVLLA